MNSFNSGMLVSFIIQAALTLLYYGENFDHIFYYCLTERFVFRVVFLLDDPLSLEIQLTDRCADIFLYRACRYNLQFIDSSMMESCPKGSKPSYYHLHVSQMGIRMGALLLERSCYRSRPLLQLQWS